MKRFETPSGSTPGGDFLDDVFNSDNKENPEPNRGVNRLAEIKSPESDESVPSNTPQSSQNSSPGFVASTPQKDSKASTFLKAWELQGNLNSQTEPGASASSSRTLDLLQVSSSNTRVGNFPKNVRARKFPGPAGLLPERQGNSSLVATEEFLSDLENENRNVPVPEVSDLLSQDSSRTFELGCWGALVEDLGRPGGDELLASINVKNIRNKAKNSRSLKVPFLALLLQSVDSTTPDPCLSLRDTTGEMHGALHRDVWERHGEHLVPGCVLVLRNVGVISAGFTSKRHYLNITENNVATIYTTYKSDEVKRININPILRGDISRLLEEWEKLVPAPPILPVDSPSSSPVRLFSSAVDGGGSTPRPPPRFNVQRQPRPQFRPLGSPRFGGQPRSLGPPRGGLPAMQSRPMVPLRFGGQPRQHVTFRTPAPSRPRIPSPAPCPPNPGQAPKRPRFEANPVGNSVFSVNSSQAEDVVESLLDGLDADSLFGDF